MRTETSQVRLMQAYPIPWDWVLDPPYRPDVYNHTIHSYYRQGSTNLADTRIYGRLMPLYQPTEQYNEGTLSMRYRLMGELKFLHKMSISQVIPLAEVDRFLINISLQKRSESFHRKSVC